LKARPLLYAQTSGATPFRLSTHVGDVGHMLIVGPTGAGKSVMLALIAMQFRRYKDAQVYIFDKGCSARAAVLAMGGSHHGLGADSGEGIAFQPLRGIDAMGERAWASDWICALLANEKVTVTPDVKDMVWSALGNLASAPPQERTLTGLAMLLQSKALRTALGPTRSRALRSAARCRWRSLSSARCNALRPRR
jgi:type IV secretion system protein VirB4